MTFINDSTTCFSSASSFSSRCLVHSGPVIFICPINFILEILFALVRILYKLDVLRTSFWRRPFLTPRDNSRNFANFERDLKFTSSKTDFSDDNEHTSIARVFIILHSLHICNNCFVWMIIFLTFLIQGSIKFMSPSNRFICNTETLTNLSQRFLKTSKSLVDNWLIRIFTLLKNASDWLDTNMYEQTSLNFKISATGRYSMVFTIGILGKLHIFVMMYPLLAFLLCISFLNISFLKEKMKVRFLQRFFPITRPIILMIFSDN